MADAARPEGLAWRPLGTVPLDSAPTSKFTTAAWSTSTPAASSADTLTWAADASGLKLEGEIGCKGNIVIDVFKLIALVEPGADPEDVNALVQTFRYAYNASVRGHGNFLRHDNAHPYPGHPDQHHRHEFDWRTGDELPGFPRWVGTQGWPTLGDFIEEVSDWYWKHRDELPEPDAVPVLGLR